ACGGECSRCANTLFGASLEEPLLGRGIIRHHDQLLALIRSHRNIFATLHPNMTADCFKLGMRSEREGKRSPTPALAFAKVAHGFSFPPAGIPSETVAASNALCAHTCSGFLHALRCPLTRLLLHPGDKRTQLRRGRHGLTRWARRPSWHRQRRDELG